MADLTTISRRKGCTKQAEMTLTKSSQKRLRSDEDNEDILPRTKRREHYFTSTGIDQPDAVGNSHLTQPTCSSMLPKDHESSAFLTPSTSPVAGATAFPSSLPHPGADIAAALHNTHLDHQHFASHQPSLSHPSLVKDAGMPHPAAHPSLGPLPDVVHQTNEEYYLRVNRLLRTAHFDRLKRTKEVSHAAAYEGDTHN